jgi:hypothetical protein
MLVVIAEDFEGSCFRSTYRIICSDCEKKFAMHLQESWDPGGYDLRFGN